MSANNIGNEGAKALGPYLVKLNNLTALLLSCTWLGLCLGRTKDRVACWRCCMTGGPGFVCACVMPANNIGEEGAKALGPHLAKLSNMTALYLGCAWRRRRCFFTMHRTWLFGDGVA